MDGRIAPIGRQSIEDRSAVLVRGWVNERARAPQLPVSGPLRPASAMGMAELRSGLRGAPPSEPLLFLLSRHAPPPLSSFLLESARPDRCVYVLATTGFGEGTRDPGLRDLGRARVLVRRVSDLPASGVLVGRGAAGFFWPGGHEGEPRWTLELGSSQGPALFTAFLHLFWHHAVDEAFTTGKPLAFRPAKKRPFDVTPSAHAPVKLLTGVSNIAYSNAGAACGPPDVPLSGDPRALLTKPGAEHHGVLGERAAAGCSVVSNDLDLPPFALGAAERTMAASSRSWSLHVDLDDAQVSALRGIVDALVAAPTWRFHASSPLGVLAGKPVWLAGAPEAAIPLQEQVLDAGRTSAVDLRSVPSTDSPARPAPHPLAVSVRVQWTVEPPWLPAGVSADKLVLAWSKVDQDTHDRLQAVRAKLDSVEQHAKGVGERLLSLASALLGFERERTSLRTELDDLARLKPSQRGPAGARETLERLRVLEDKVGKLADDQRDTERKEEERLNVERQRIEWERVREQKAGDLERAKADLQIAKEQQEHLRTAVQEAEDAYRKETDKDAKKDRYTQKSKLDDDLAAVKKEVQRCEGRARNLEHELQQPFKPKPLERPAVPVPKGGAAAGARFVPPPAPADLGAAPTEALPSVGSLRAVKGQRYLVIEHWKDLDAGEEEARRLSAKLVAPAEGT